jgi:hypothetical protein
MGPLVGAVALAPVDPKTKNNTPATANPIPATIMKIPKRVTPIGRVIFHLSQWNVYAAELLRVNPKVCHGDAHVKRVEAY